MMRCCLTRKSATNGRGFTWRGGRRCASSWRLSGSLLDRTASVRLAVAELEAEQVLGAPDGVCHLALVADELVGVPAL